ncbi:hypothetical protein ACHAWO_010934 [Cyclotella atomus]|uniref:Uncharacterized protein n=1 Tax=Cyclotella atomus TaxID=382360 RepID=A0ABD3Q198_9STRA
MISPKSSAAAAPAVVLPSLSAAATVITAEAESTEPKQYQTTTTEQSQILTSINTTLTSLKSSHIQKYSNQGQQKCTFHLQCMDATVDSIKSQLQSVTESVEDDLLDGQLYKFRFSRQHHLEEEDDSTSSEEEQDVSFDDDDILDAEAYNKVRELRRRTREVAGRVISVREEALEGALGVAGKSLEELLRVHGFCDQQPTEDEGENEDAAENTRISEVPLNSALKNLTSTLQNVDSGLYRKLESIKETIGTIDSAVDKCQRVARGEENVLSQTEQALIAASNVRERVVVEEEEVGEETMNDVDRNLARLLAGL